MDWKEQAAAVPVPKLKSVEQVSDGWIKKYILTYTMPDGREHRYESVSRKGADAYTAELRAYGAGKKRAGQADAVCIAPITRDGRVVMIREFRYPLNSWCIGLPAGLMEEGEDPLECAVRELWEETGFAAVRNEDGSLRARLLDQAGFSSVGMSAESVQVMHVQVEDEPSLGQNTEASEFIQVFTLPVAEIGEFLAQNALPIGTRAQLVLLALANDPDPFA